MKSFRETLNENYNKFYVKTKEGKTRGVHTSTQDAFKAVKPGDIVVNNMGEEIDPKTGLPK